jgi:hypothetical protein
MEKAVNSLYCDGAVVPRVQTSFSCELDALRVVRRRGSHIF